MTGTSSGGVCSGKGVYIKLSVLLLLSTTIYVYLYSSITMQTFVIGEVMKGTISDIQRWRDKMEGWVQMIGGSGSQSNNKDAKNTSFPDDNRDVMKIKVQKSKPDIGSVIKATNESKLLFVPHEKTRTPIHDSKSKGAGHKPEVLLTLFTSWPTKAEKYLCHNNTIRNWLQLKPLIHPVLFTNETLLAEEAMEKGWDVLPIRRAGRGVPILKHMYKDVIGRYSSSFYAFSNGDILYSNSLIDTLKAVLNSSQVSKGKPIMIVGRRTNVQDVTSEEASSGKSVQRTANIRGKIFTVWAEDYFITSTNYPWKDIPEVVIGRRAYDNWLVSNARKQKHVTIDATDTLVALHQTTKAGNQEGFKADNPEYNHNLLRRMYHQLHYGAGLTSCAEYYTRYHGNKNIQILKRAIPKSCFPV
ncbi:uncharacterized protein LOC110448187 [Mizuhopecten yessoensis]|uniref:Uncharacterized protein n=1 Tax=Mizuhopecten yessoensis TaxID=6573 RepID=A0A210QTT2_MIZYE|nr:uncharacterized protein LOC110448187 [Mizuhopecten yessoensis]OWF52120.1 hypothetical protein KP79_PYT13332 [Mizuhopecten yessoensis]